MKCSECRSIVCEECGHCKCESLWKDIWKEEPPKNIDILFMTGDEEIHIGYLSGNEKLRKCQFRSYFLNEFYDCDKLTEYSERVIYWHQLPVTAAVPQSPELLSSSEATRMQREIVVVL